MLDEADPLIRTRTSYDSPAAVMADARLTREQKLRNLRAWADQPEVAALIDLLERSPDDEPNEAPAVRTDLSPRLIPVASEVAPRESPMPRASRSATRLLRGLGFTLGLGALVAIPALLGMPWVGGALFCMAVAFVLLFLRGPRR